VSAALPDNVLRTSALPWEPRGWPSGWGSADKNLSPRFPFVHLGARISELAPDTQAFPLHWHVFREEHVLVLDGVLTVLERTPDGRRREFPVRTGELVAWPANSGIAHACRNRDSRPVRFLAVSDQPGQAVVHYADSGKVWIRALGGPGLWDGRAPGESAVPPRDPDQVFAQARSARDAATVQVLGTENRPRHVAGWLLGELTLGEPPRCLHGRPLSRHAGARQVFVNLDRLTPGCHPSPLHRHHSNEELLLVIAGEPTLRQVSAEGQETRVKLAQDDVVHWAPGGVAHQLLNEGRDDAVYAVVGTDRADEVTSFPDRGDHYVAALGQVGHFTPRGYLDGED